MGVRFNQPARFWNRSYAVEGLLEVLWCKTTLYVILSEAKNLF
jgi:hypothetical protein